MRPFVAKPVSRINGKLTLAGDKSIAHRALIISALAKGTTQILNIPANEDCLYTLNALKQLGVKIIYKPKNYLTASCLTVNVTGQGLSGLSKPGEPIFVGDSGTTMRLLLGVLAGQSFETKLIAGRSLSHRPMLRVNQPLRKMGALIKSHETKTEEYPPITIRGGVLKPISYRMPVASAQVKSAILLAGLYAKGKTRVREPVKTRDHTERMLKLFQARLKLIKNQIVITNNHDLVSPGQIIIPGDISSAAFFMVLGAMLPDSRLVIKNVSLNPIRAAILNVLKKMGANIKIIRRKEKTSFGGELMGDILVQSSRLKGITVKAKEIPSIIDELPVLMVAACSAHGKTIFENVQELRLKETDRIRSMSQNLRKMGAMIEVLKKQGRETVIIRGIKQLSGTRLKGFGDHRTCLSLIVAGLTARGKSRIDDISCINKSFPDFIRVLGTLIH